MPVYKPPIDRTVTVQWLGGDVIRRVRAGTRLALRTLGTEGQHLAQAIVRKDTTTLEQNIEVRIPRSAPGSARYVVLLGVFEDGPDIIVGGNTQPAWTYAFWQETLPEPRGRAFLRPALDHMLSDYERVFKEIVRFKIGFRRGRLPAGASAQSYSEGSHGFDEGGEE